MKAMNVPRQPALSSALGLAAGLTLLLLAGAEAAGPAPRRPAIRYAGSSTIANFIRDAEPVYGRTRFVLDTEVESGGAEAALLEGRADLAGVAGVPTRKTLELGVEAAPIGRDAIAVIVHRDNPIEGLSLRQLEDVFTGKVRSWKDLGGDDRPVRPYVVGPVSATRNVFRSAVLGESDYEGCEPVSPDEDLIARVERDPGGIGAISFSFLAAAARAKPLVVDGEAPSPMNASYPIARPLYLLWWPGRASVAAFVSWTRTPEARALLLARFALAPVEEERP